MPPLPSAPHLSMADTPTMPGGTASPTSLLGGDASTPSKDVEAGSDSSKSTATVTQENAAKTSTDPNPSHPVASPSRADVSDEGTAARSGTASGTTHAQTSSSISISIQGLRVNFNIEFAQLAHKLYTWLRDFFVAREDRDGSVEGSDSEARISHTPRRIAFMVLCLAVVTVWVNWSYSTSTSPCLWRAHTDALADLQISRIGALLNSTAHGASRFTELNSGRLGISELRNYVQEHYHEGQSAAALNNVLKEYGDEMAVVLQKLVRMDASITALVHITIAHNAATYHHLDLSGRTPRWLSFFCWSACQGASFEVIYLDMLNLEDALLHALDATQYDSISLRDAVQRLYGHSSHLQNRVNSLGLSRSTSLPDGQSDALSSLWDSVAPYRTPTTMKTNRRRTLISVRASQRRTMDYALATYENVLNLAEQMRLLKLGLKSRSTSWFSFLIWSPTPEFDSDLCFPHTLRGIKPFKPLLLAVNELRTMLTRRD
ncbi:unnamed protein product [Peniophora sp. CBMAI 1063]|nr:unnamed protein product [Peniophora sp. CBMAI 1063]